MAGDFEGFISYSRRASSRLATDLQGAVERFAKPWYQLRAVRIFRDDATMSANVALWPTIEAALTEAEWLILLASPGAAASQWVGNEVQWWLDHKTPERILIVLEEGEELVWDRAAGDFDWPNTASLPPALRGAFSEEPRWIDLRWYEADGSLEKADPRWPERVADIAAAVRFAERDQLIGENVREHRRARRLLRAGIIALSVLLVASLIATVFAVLQSKEANRQADIARAQEREATRQARIALARQLAAQADALAPRDLRTASLLAVEAFRTNDDAQTRATLFQVASASPQLVQALPVSAEVTAVAATPDGVVVTGSEDGRVRLWRDGEPTEVVDLAGSIISVSVSDDASAVVAVAVSSDSHEVVLWREGQTVDLGEIREADAAVVSPDGGHAASSGFTGTAVWSLGNEVTLSGRSDVDGSVLAFGPRGLAVFSGTGDWALVDPETLSVLERGFHSFPIGNLSLALSADGSSLAAWEGRRDYDVWRGPATYSDRSANFIAATDLADTQGIALSHDGSRLATFADGELSVVKVSRLAASPPRPTRLPGSGVANREAISFGGSHLLVTGSGSEALVWDIDQLFRFGRNLPADVPDECTYCRPPGVLVSPDGRRVLIVNDPTSAGPSLIDLRTGEQRPLDPDDSLQLSAATWLADGSVLALSAAESELVGFAPSGGDPEVLASSGSDDGSSVLALSSDGSSDGLVTLLRESGVVETIDLASGASVFSSDALAGPLASDRPPIFGIAPDQTTAFVEVQAADGSFTSQLAVLDLATDEVNVTTTPGVVGAAYDAESRLHVFDGAQVGVLGAAGQLEDLKPAEVVGDPPVVMDADATIAVSGGLDGTVHLVDLVRQGAEFGTFTVPQERGSYALSAFSPDGATLVTAVQPMETFGLASSLRVLSLDPFDWVAAACRLAGRDLTAEEWSRYSVGAPPPDLRCDR